MVTSMPHIAKEQYHSVEVYSAAANYLGVGLGQLQDPDLLAAIVDC